MSLQSAGGGDYSTLVINTLINRTQNVIYADSTPSTVFQGEVTIPRLRITEAVTNAPGPISITGDVNVSGVLGANKQMKGIIVGNRDFAKCDANGDGLPGENPNAGQTTNTFWGNSEFKSTVVINKLQNPGDVNNLYGLGLEVKNSSSKPYATAFGFPQPALTAFNLGHDATYETAEFNETFSYYGPGHYRNKISMDSSDNIFSTTPAMVITMPTRSLITSLSVLNGTYISTAGNVGTISRVNAFHDYQNVGLPVPGMTVTISAEPPDLNVTNAIISSVTPRPGTTHNEFDLTYEFNVGGTYTSTKVYYVYLGPAVSGFGSFGQVTFGKGPRPLIGQKITVLVQPTSLNVTNATITNVTYGSTSSQLSYNLTAPLSSPASAFAITSVKLVPSTYGSNTNYGGQGNFGIHTLTPEASLDVTGDVIFREVTTGNPMIRTTTNPVPGFGTTCNMVLANPFDSVQPSVFVDYDLTNQRISYKSRITDTTMFQIDAVNGIQTYYNPDISKVLDITCLQAPSAFTFYDISGGILFKLDQDANSVYINPTATFSFPSSTSSVNGMLLRNRTVPFSLPISASPLYYSICEWDVDTASCYPETGVVNSPSNKYSMTNENIAWEDGYITGLVLAPVRIHFKLTMQGTFVEDVPGSTGNYFNAAMMATDGGGGTTPLIGLQQIPLKDGERWSLSMDYPVYINMNNIGNYYPEFSTIGGVATVTTATLLMTNWAA